MRLETLLFVPEALNQHTPRYRPMRAWLRLMFVLSLLMIACGASPALAANRQQKLKQPWVSKLQGTWTITLIGFTGCGQSAMLVEVTLDAHGKGSATTTYHTQCGDNKQSGLPFAVQNLKADGRGTAGLSCGTACGWEFQIQVNQDATIFNLVDVDPSNPGNFVQGVAIHQ
jgi:hypothetical protein